MSSITTPTQELVTRVHAALSGDGAADAEIAEEFVELCEDANSRLSTFRQLSGEGDHKGAVKEAEQEPALIEVFEMLGKFRRLPAWNAHCEKHDLPVAPKVEIQVEPQLIGVYKKWSGSEEFLRKKYRDAIIRKDRALALAGPVSPLASPRSRASRAS